MRVPLTLLIGVLPLVMAACSPTFNWRETSIAGTSLMALFPCKPEVDTREVSMGGSVVELHMAHCDAGAVTFAVGHARVAEPALASLVMAQWRRATLASLHASATNTSPWTFGHMVTLPESVAVAASGTGANGKLIDFKGVWFSRDGEVLAAFLYAPALPSDVINSFFPGLRFR